MLQQPVDFTKDFDVSDDLASFLNPCSFIMSGDDCLVLTISHFKSPVQCVTLSSVMF